MRRIGRQTPGYARRPQLRQRLTVELRHDDARWHQSSHRSPIVVSREAVKLLNEWRIRSRARVPSDCHLIFASRNGTPVQPTIICRTWTRILKKAGVPYRKPHTARHTQASLLLAAGANPKVISERLGHATEGFTLAVYAHLLPGMQEQAAEALERIVTGEGPTAEASE